ncbi:phytoene desaturase family protein [Pseudonocardia adelaidensis]|uniref:Pyridine nucleotide-disulfide oxidoreductase domain-containing protein 2 n=1 Tax=Pseudonocardia adelaidensis TaxID=648754 RepID=A0ABP9NLF8_9PSEU
MEEFDVVIVGGGHQGLVAATDLAEAGISTAVVEAAPEVGGAVRSAEVTEPGFVHDLYATNMNLFLGSPFFGRYGDELASGGLRFARSEAPYASAFHGGSSLRIASDEAATLAMWKEHSAADADGWMQLRRVFDGLVASYLPLYTSPQPSWTTLTFLRAVRRNRRSVPLGEFAATLLSSTRALGDRYFSTPEAKSLAAAWGMHLDFGPDIAGGAVFSLLEMYADMLNGMSVVEGGAGRLPEALAGLVRRRGGTVLTGVPVARVDTDSTGATGVTLADGRRLRARRGVVSTVVLPRLVGDLLADAAVPADMRAAADGYRFGPGTFMLHLALDGPVPWQDERLASCAYVHAGSYVDDMARTYQQSLARLLPDEPLLVVGQTSVVDPTRVPVQGRHLVWVQVRTVPGSIKGDAGGRIAGTSWSDVREPYADRVLDVLEGYAPGLKAVVRARAAFSPDDLQQQNCNLAGGDSVAGSHHLDQLLMLRPSLALSRYRTPIPRLYLAGAGTWPGAGVNAVSGVLAAETLLRDAGRRRPPGRGRRLRGTR